MGLMDPEELSCSRVETDKSSVIKSLDFPECGSRDLNEHGHLNEFSCNESANSLALTLVSDILDESIEIFNKVDESNIENNNSELADSSKNNSSAPCNSKVKTDLVVSCSINVDTSNKFDKTSCNNFESSPSPISVEGSNSEEDSMALLQDPCVNIPFQSLVERRHSTSSEEDSESPIISESESSISQSNDNIPSHFSNPLANEDNIISNKILDLNTDSMNYNEVPLTSQKEIAYDDSDAPSNFKNEMNKSTDPFVLGTNDLQSDVTENLLPLESNSECYHLYSNPAVLEISETSQHDCFKHPDILELKKEHEEMSNMFQIYKDKASRLDDCLLDIEKMLDKVGFLEKKICQQEMEIDLAKQERDIEFKALSSLKQESTAKIDSLKKKYEQANKEKESMVMRYAKSEKELLDMKKEKATLLKQIKDQQKENENVLSKLRLLSDDKSRLAVALDNKNMDLSTSHKEIDKLKEDINSRDIKIKWIQNKLIGEMDLHKECPDKIEKLTGRIIELEKKLEKDKENIEQYKKTIQELEAIKVLEGQVREEQAKLILERHDQSERVIKMKALQLKTDALIEENNNLSFQVQNLEVERLDLEKRLSESRQESQELSNNLADLRSKLVQFDSISNQLAQERERLEKANEEVERLRKANEELMQDMSSCRSREAEMLSFTQKLTTKNVQLQSEFSNIESRAGELMLEAEKAESVSDTLKRELKMLKEELEVERCKREEERNLLAREVAEGRSKISHLESHLTETKSNLHSSSNKHQALIRELQRELQVCHRKLEGESKSTQNSSQPNDSHSNSGSSPNQSFTGRSSPAASSSLTSSLNSIPDATIVQPFHHQLEVSPGILVERILKLQTDAKNYQDKIEFLEDHNTSLVEELKKKRKLLQSYILREQAGALASQASDIHKKEVSKHGGIMASVYGSKPTDEGMTLELSLEISHKLQAILEDTLLKNITLKENIDTLGDEIERLKKLHPS